MQKPFGKGEDESQGGSLFGIGFDGQVDEYPCPSSFNRQDDTFVDADKSRIMII